MEKTLHSFTKGLDGGYSLAGLTRDAAGNLYGAAESGGGVGKVGTVFELSPTSAGGWKKKVLHAFSFPGMDSNGPFSAPIFDAVGNLYGTASGGGLYGKGTVYKLSPLPGGGWKETILHSFVFNNHDGLFPQAGLVFDASGNLFGVTCYGGDYGGDVDGGTVFELSPSGGGWVEKILHSFNHHTTDGDCPDGHIVLDNSGSIYGTTDAGGVYDNGTVFEVTP